MQPKTNESLAGDRRELLRGPLDDVRIAVLIVLLTLNAGWVDALAFLSLGRVFASFLSGNFIFIGLGIAQNQTGLLIRALVSVGASFVGSTFASYRLDRELERRTAPTLRSTFVPVLVLEAVPLLVFAIAWHFTGVLSQHGEMQVLLLALAAFAMGMQGALISTLDLPGIVANALTGTVITFGRRVAEHLDHPRSKTRDWRSSTFIASLPLLYVGSALVVALAAPSDLPAIVPVLIVSVAVVTLLVPSRRPVEPVSTGA